MSNKKLTEHFIPTHYRLNCTDAGGLVVLTIHGKRVGRPSKRLAFHQVGLKVKSAQIIYKNKNKTIEHEIIRINHLPTFQEVRLHTAQVQYPGNYEITLDFSGADVKEIKKLHKSVPLSSALRQHFPAIDESEAKKDIAIEIF